LRLTGVFALMSGHHPVTARALQLSLLPGGG
jgi:hypothetical protein